MLVITGKKIIHIDKTDYFRQMWLKSTIKLLEMTQERNALKAELENLKQG